MDKVWARWAASAAVMTLALSACTRADEPDIRPPLPEPSVAVVTEPTVRRLEGGAMPVTLGLLVPGVRGVSTEAREPVPSFVQYPVIDGGTEFNTAVAEWISSHRREMADAPTDGQSELNIGWSVAASDPFRIGTMLVSREHRGEELSVVYRTLVQDRSTGAAITTSAYLTPDGRTRLTSLVREALTSRGVATLDIEATGPVQDSLGDGLGLDEGGNVVVAIDAGLLTPSREGALSLTLPRESVRPLLNPRGVAWLDGVAPPGEVRTPQPLPGETVAPSANPVPQASVDCREVRCVAITIENGPSDATASTLAVLEREGVRATFFVLGTNVDLYPSVVRQMADDGHVVANHSWDHLMLTAMPQPVAVARIRRTNDKIEALTGTRPTLMRAPYDALPPGLATDGTAVVGWTVTLAEQPGQKPAEAVDAAMPQIVDGSIVRVGESSATTAALVAELIPRLRAAGYAPVSLNDLLGTSLVPGKVYTRR